MAFRFGNGPVGDLGRVCQRGMLAGFAGLGFVGFRRSRKQPIAAF